MSNEDRPEPRLGTQRIRIIENGRDRYMDIPTPTITHLHGPYSAGETPMEESHRLEVERANRALHGAKMALYVSLAIIVVLAAYILTR